MFKKTISVIIFALCVMCLFTKAAKADLSASMSVAIKAAKVSLVEAIDANNTTRKSRDKLQMVSKDGFSSREATVKAYKDNTSLNWTSAEPVWSGLESDSGTDVISVSTATGGIETATAGDVSKDVNIEIVDANKHEISIGTSAFQSIKDILSTTASVLGGSSADVTSSVSGEWVWYKVDQNNSPMCNITDELSANGKFSLSHKFYIPSLSMVFPFVKVGVFAEPDLSLTITGINIKRDGAVNPVAFTEVSGGASLEGSISGGAGVEIEDPLEVLSVEADLKGTAGAGGSFSVALPGPKLSGEYHVGKITVSGMVKIKYRNNPFIEQEITKEVWDGITGTREVDLSSYFTGK